PMYAQCLRRQVDSHRCSLFKVDRQRAAGERWQACDVAPDFVSSREPCDVRAGEDGVDHHQTLDHPTCGNWSAMSAVGLTDRLVQRQMVHLVDVPAIVTTLIARCVVPTQELRKERACPLTMDGAGERAVLLLQADSGVAHHH